MPVITASTAIVVAETDQFEEEIPLILMPENSGTEAFRELHYPNNVFPPLVYVKNPDKWENFDSTALTARPIIKVDKTFEGGQITKWTPYGLDFPVREIWEGGGKRLSMPAYFFRRMWEFFVNQPPDDYITWYPKDRTTQSFNIEIENLTVGGQDTIFFNLGAMQDDYLLEEVQLTFRIISAV